MEKKKQIKWLVVFALIVGLTAAIVITANAVSGAAFTTFNPSVDGASKDVCKNSIINCNIYGAKEYVWLNGGPAANGLGPDGEYFFAVLEPGGQPNPNDQDPVLVDRNLSDDFDAYTNRTFTVTDGEVSAYSGTHDLDSGTGDICKNGNGPNSCDNPDGLPPFIRLFPYSDTTNPGGVYILAICSLEDGYPVVPRDCKYDAFKVKEGKVTYNFVLSGIKFEDLDANGAAWEVGEPKLPGWTITIDGFGFDGEPINTSVETDEFGEWMYTSQDYSFGPKDPVYDAELTICEEVLPGWYQSYPDPSCYDITIPPSGAAARSGLNFGNFKPVSITAVKFYDRDQDGVKDEGEAWIEGFQFCLYVGDQTSTTYVGPGDFVADPDPACQLTDANGVVTWDNLYPGTYTVMEEDADYWIPTTATFATFMLYSGDSETAYFGNVAVCDGLTPGYWSNWRNHYTEDQFLFLLQGTIAEGDVGLADYYLNSTGCDGDEGSLHCMRRFLLANELTLNLTMYPDLPNPDGAELYLACQIVEHEVNGNLGYWLDLALTIHYADGVGYLRDDILEVKTVLDWFANMYFNPLVP